MLAQVLSELAVFSPSPASSAPNLQSLSLHRLAHDPQRVLRLPTAIVRRVRGCKCFTVRLEQSHLRKTCDRVQLKSLSLYVSSLSSPNTFKKEKKKTDTHDTYTGQRLRLALNFIRHALLVTCLALCVQRRNPARPQL